LRSSPAGGEGRVGQVAVPEPLADLAQRVKSVLHASHVHIVGDAGKEVRRLALVCGAGGDFLNDAVAAGADAFLTGEARFHDYLAAQAHGLALILPGHYASERCGIEELAARLQQRWPDLEIWASRRERDPVLVV
jgi:putative NIF3 family GTP cyclohydrolase 1 type 2